jgi:hypothetical protein
VYKYLFQILLLIGLDIDPEEELLDQIVFVNTPKFFVLKVMGAAGYT